MEVLSKNRRIEQNFCPSDSPTDSQATMERLSTRRRVAFCAKKCPKTRGKHFLKFRIVQKPLPAVDRSPGAVDLVALE